MGRSQPSTTVVQPPPPQIIERPLPQETAGETSRQLFESQLEFNPQLIGQEVDLLRQFAPQQAQIEQNVLNQTVPQAAQREFGIQAQFAPLYRALVESQFPQIPVLADQVSQGLASPEGLPAGEQALQSQGRERARGQIRQNVRESAQLGGNLFSGARRTEEQDALSRFEQDILSQDIARRQQERMQRLSELTQLFQLAGFQVQQPTVGLPNVPSFGAPVTPDANALLAAQTQAFLNPVVNRATVGIGPSARSQNAQIISGISQGIGSAIGCHVAEVLYGTYDIRTWLARWYVATHDSPFLRLYRRFSVAWAAGLRRIPWLSPWLRPIWDSMWKKQLEEISNGD